MQVALCAGWGPAQPLGAFMKPLERRPRPLKNKTNFSFAAALFGGRFLALWMGARGAVCSGSGRIVLALRSASSSRRARAACEQSVAARSLLRRRCGHGDGRLQQNHRQKVGVLFRRSFDVKGREFLDGFAGQQGREACIQIQCVKPARHRAQAQERHLPHEVCLPTCVHSTNLDIKISSGGASAPVQVSSGRHAVHGNASSRRGWAAGAGPLAERCTTRRLGVTHLG